MSFTLTVLRSCQIQEITPPVTTNFVHKVNDAKATYTVPEFANSEVECPLTYTMSYDTTQTWIVEKSAR